MTGGLTPPRQRGVFWLLLLGSTAVALIVARPHADGYNDGSRLGTVESLVDHGTFAFDRSIFVSVPSVDVPPEQFPYRLRWADKIRGDSSPYETGDKVFVRGHYYSDKPATQAVLLAGVYQVLQWTTGLRARENAPLFCYLMTLASSGVCFVLLVLFSERLFQRLGLPLSVRLVLTASLALSTLALHHLMHVGAHICQLGLAAVVFERLAALRERPPQGWPTPQLLLLGLLTGLCYGLEQAAGGLLLGTVGLYLLITGGLRHALWYGVGTLPFFLLHHGITYALAGTFRPINSFPEHFEYPGSVFGAENMTGRWNHSSPGAFFLYLGQMLFGNQGFLQYNLPLFLLFPSVFALIRNQKERSLILPGLAWATATWLVYGSLSVDYSGGGLSIRWFLPLLVIGYLMLALVVRDHPEMLRDVVILSFGSFVLTLVACFDGPGPVQQEVFWFVQGATLACWVVGTSLCPAGLDSWLHRHRSGLLAVTLLALVVVSLTLYAVEPRPLSWIEGVHPRVKDTGRGAVTLILGGLLGLLARAESVGDSRRGAFQVGLALVLAVGVFAVGAALLHPGPPICQAEESYRIAFNQFPAFPTILSILPVGLLRGIERMTGSFLEAWFIVSWLACLIPAWVGLAWFWPQRRNLTASTPTPAPTSNPTR